MQRIYRRHPRRPRSVWDTGKERFWAQTEISSLKQLWPHAEWPHIISNLPGRTRSAIHQKARECGFQRLRDAKAPWSVSEIKTLKEMWPAALKSDICNAFPRRTWITISRKAAQLKIGRERMRKWHSPFAIIRELRKIRRDRGISQIELADKIGTHHIQIAKWERGEIVPRLRTFFDWIEALEFSLALVPRADTPR